MARLLGTAPLVAVSPIAVAPPISAPPISALAANGPSAKSTTSGTPSSTTSPTASPTASPTTYARVEYDAPPGCSSVEVFEAGIRSRTTRVRIVREGPADLLIRLRVIRAGTQVQGELVLVDHGTETESRAMGGLSCEEVVQALSLTAALALDPSATALPSPNATSPSSPGSGAPRPTGAMGSTPSTAETTGLDGSTGPSPGVPGTARPGAPTAAPAPGANAISSTASSLPYQNARPGATAGAAAYEFEAGAQLRIAHLIEGHLGAGGALLARIDRLDGVVRQTLGLALLHVRDDLLGTPHGISTALTALAVSLCPVRAEAGHLALTPCAELTGGWLRATGQGVAHPIGVDRSYWSTGGALYARFAVARGFALELQAAVAIPLVERIFTTSPPDTQAGQTAAVYTSAGIGFIHPF